MDYKIYLLTIRDLPITYIARIIYISFILCPSFSILTLLYYCLLSLSLVFYLEQRKPPLAVIRIAL